MADFASLYELFLDGAYRGPTRARFVASMVEILRSRGAKRLLDCAAGTGFPALDIAAEHTPDIAVHCTDSSQEMLAVLSERAGELQVDIEQLAPELWNRRSGPLAELRLSWDQLGEIRRPYDYVMCRGNSLAYANSWGGGEEVSSIEAIADFLSEMKRLVKPGGYLHVDAPQQITLSEQHYRPVGTDGISIVEKVTNYENRRSWNVQFDLPSGKTLRFKRYSTLLTITDVKRMLDELGFIDTDPIAVDGERSAFGVIIARRPTQSV